MSITAAELKLNLGKYCSLLSPPPTPICCEDTRTEASSHIKTPSGASPPRKPIHII